MKTEVRAARKSVAARRSGTRRHLRRYSIAGIEFSPNKVKLNCV
jgi:hypothetical protein